MGDAALDALDELAGSKVRLRGPRLEDGDAFLAMDRDTDGARRWDETNLPRADARARAWMEEVVAREHRDDNRWLVVERLDDVVVGSISVSRASPRHGRFAYGLGLGSAHRRQGFGSEAVALLLRFYFGELRYHKCDTGIYDFNEASLRMHEKLGFRVEGRIRDAIFTQGGYHDEVIVGITAEDFWAQGRVG